MRKFAHVLGRAGTGMLAALLFLSSTGVAANAADVKYMSGTVTSSSCAALRVPYAYAYAVGQIYHTPPGGNVIVYTNLGWDGRGYYGPGGDWELFANSPTSWISSGQSGGSCRPI